MFSSRSLNGEEPDSKLTQVTGRIYFRGPQLLLANGWRLPSAPRCHPPFREAHVDFPKMATYFIKTVNEFASKTKPHIMQCNHRSDIHHFCHIQLVRSKSGPPIHTQEEGIIQDTNRRSGPWRVNYLRICLPHAAWMGEALKQS